GTVDGVDLVARRDDNVERRLGSQVVLDRDLEVAAPVPDGNGVGGLFETLDVGDRLLDLRQLFVVGHHLDRVGAVGQVVVGQQLLGGDRVEGLGEAVLGGQPVGVQLEHP